MKKNIILIIISVFVFSSLNAQNKKGIIYEYKKNQFTSSIGTKGFFQVGYIKRLTKNIGIGGSISHHTASSGYYSWEYVNQYDLGAGEYDAYGNNVGLAGYEMDPFLGPYESSNGPYNEWGDYIGYDGGYDRVSIYNQSSLSSIAFMADFKWNLRVKKRIQPVFMFSLGYATGLDVIIARTSFGLDLHSKNDKYVLTPFFSTLDYDDGTTIGIKFTIKK